MIWALVAAAAPLNAGLQAQVHPAGLEFLSRDVDGLEIPVGPLDIATDLSCYAITVDDFNLDITIEDLELEASSAGLVIDVDLAARGTYIDVAGASGWFDTCIDFARLVELVDLSDAHLHGVLTARVVDGELSMRFVDPPIVTGVVTTDADWFPDTLVWEYLEGVVLEQASAQLDAQLPGLVASFTEEAFLIDPLGGAPIGLSIDDVEVGADGLYAALDVDLDGPGANGADLNLRPRGDAHFAVGITEELAQGALHYSWQQGLIDPAASQNRELVQSLLDGLDLGVGAEVELTMEAAPRVGIDEGMELALSGVDLRVVSDGTEYVHFNADLAASLDVSVAAGTLTLSAHDVHIDVHELEADQLLSDDDSSADVAAFIEGWVAQAASVWVTDVPVYQSRIEALGYVLQVTDVETQPGGLAVWGRLHDADDSSIDGTAPDTTLDARVEDATIFATFGADEEDVSYSWRMDGGAWSGWSTDTSEEIAATPGSHTLEVRARDAWYNIDPSPGVADLELVAPNSAPEKTGCSTVVSPLWLGFLLLPMLRRR